MGTSVLISAPVAAPGLVPVAVWVRPSAVVAVQTTVVCSASAAAAAAQTASFACGGGGQPSVVGWHGSTAVPSRLENVPLPYTDPVAAGSSTTTVTENPWSGRYTEPAGVST